MAGRAQDLKAAAVVLRNCVRKLMQPSAENPDRWAQDSVAPTPDPLAHLSLPSILMGKFSQGFSTVVEIGCYDGARIINLKAERPAVRAIGMDIGRWYCEGHAPQRGVEFIRHDLAQIPAGAFVASVGTMVCMTGGDLEQLFQHIHDNGNTLFYFEPAPIFAIQSTVKRRGNGYFHPYLKLAAKAGLSPQIPPNYVWPHDASIKNLVRFQYQVLR